MSVYSFPEAEVWGKRGPSAGDLAVFALAGVALLTVLGAVWAGASRDAAAQPPPKGAGPAPIRARPLPPRMPAPVVFHPAERVDVLAD